MTKYGEVRSTVTDSSEHVQITSSGVGAKRVLLSGYDGANFNDGYVGSTGGIATESVPMAFRVDDVTTASTTYIGEAAVGSATSSAVWRVKKIDESGSPITVAITWAGTGKFDQIYDNRTSLTYN